MFRLYRLHAATGTRPAFLHPRDIGTEQPKVTATGKIAVIRGESKHLISAAPPLPGASGRLRYSTVLILLRIFGKLMSRRRSSIRLFP